MLKDLSWLAPGQPFPPKSETERLEMCQKNKQLFECEHAKVYEEQFKRIERVIGNFNEIVSYPVILNFQKLMSTKIVDLIFGEPPTITCGEKNSKEQKAIDTIIANSDLINTSSMVGIDVSRYGDGLFFVRQEDGAGVIDLTQPPMWYPIIDANNVRKKTADVIAWINTSVSNGVTTQTITANIYETGKITTRVYKFDGSTIGPMISETITENGMKGSSIVQVSNMRTSDRCTGIDDYRDVDTIISEIMVRIGQISRILDKHASPSMVGPSSALEQDPFTGEWRFKAGNYVTRDSSDDPEAKYLTWDGQLTASFTELDRLMNLLYTISEMGSAMFGDMASIAGNVPSGTALRRLMISPLTKAGRIRTRFDKALKTAITLCSQLGGPGVVDLTGKEITITWQDGLPADDKEMADIMAIRTGNKATISQRSAIKKMDSMDDDAAEEEYSKIVDEEAEANGVPSAPVVGEESEEVE
jgi:Phage portal protein, SPP1 Gp6-like